MCNNKIQNIKGWKKLIFRIWYVEKLSHWHCQFDGRPINAQGYHSPLQQVSADSKIEPDVQMWNFVHCEIRWSEKESHRWDHIKNTDTLGVRITIQYVLSNLLILNT